MPPTALPREPGCHRTQRCSVAGIKVHGYWIRRSARPRSLKAESTRRTYELFGAVESPSYEREISAAHPGALTKVIQTPDSA